MSTTWRVKDETGAVHEAPKPVWRVATEDWAIEVPGLRSPVPCGDTATECVLEWVRYKYDVTEPREIVEPGQLFASEQVEAALANARRIVWEETEYRHNVASVALEKLDLLIAQGPKELNALVETERERCGLIAHNRCEKARSKRSEHRARNEREDAMMELWAANAAHEILEDIRSGKDPEKE